MGRVRQRWGAVLGLLLTAALVASSCSSTPTNVLLITVDTLRPDHLGYSGHQRATSPAIDRLAASGVRFERCYSQAGWTLPSVASIITGLYPAQHGATRASRKMRDDIPTMASVLRDNGYDTRAFVSHGFLQTRFGLESGFDHYDASALDVGHPHRVASAEPLTDSVIEVWGSLEPPFFVWVHYFDPHVDYLRHEEWAHFGRKAIDRYDSEIAHTDRQIGRLLDILETSGLAASTVVVFTADHGEEFGEHAGILHHGLYEEDVRIPLIIRVPGVEPRLESAVAEQIDIMPTVLDLVGLEPPDSLPGRVVLPPKGTDRPVFMERVRPSPFRQQAAILGSKKIYRVEVVDEVADIAAAQRRTGVRPGIRIYDLATDPDEKRNLFREEDPESKELLALLDTLAGIPRFRGRNIGVDDETRRRLRSLGYLD